MSYATIPLSNGYSPAELLYSRKFRSSLAVLNEKLQSKNLQNEHNKKNKLKQYFDNRYGVSDLWPLENHQVV